nr:unnamed protein product [Digitaria exilis]
MDKVLAFSILSASPADIASGAGAFTTRLSWRRGAGTSGRHHQDADEPANKANKDRMAMPMVEAKTSALDETKQDRAHGASISNSGEKQGKKLSLLLERKGIAEQAWCPNHGRPKLHR